MRKVNAIIERASDGNYSIYSDAEDLDYLITGTGSTVEEAKRCYEGGYADMRRVYAEDGKWPLSWLTIPRLYRWQDCHFSQESISSS